LQGEKRLVAGEKEVSCRGKRGSLQGEKRLVAGEKEVRCRGKRGSLQGEKRFVEKRSVNSNSLKHKQPLTSASPCRHCCWGAPLSETVGDQRCKGSKRCKGFETL
jgi:hypothetical protein